MNSAFQLWPCIDLSGGAIVRLKRGDFSQQTQYQASVPDLLSSFARFAEGVHVVDLDGAKNGHAANAEMVKAVVESSANHQLPVELGGGVRTLQDAEARLEQGISRVIVSTAAVEQSDFLPQCLRRFGAARIALGLDIRSGQVATRGWQAESAQDAQQLLQRFADAGLQRVILTDIARDGTLGGVCADFFADFVARFPQLDIFAAGGVARLQDLHALRQAGCAGAVFGKALYEGAITAEELVSFAGGR